MLRWGGFRYCCRQLEVPGISEENHHHLKVKSTENFQKINIKWAYSLYIPKVDGTTYIEEIEGKSIMYVTPHDTRTKAKYKDTNVKRCTLKKKKGKQTKKRTATLRMRAIMTNPLSRGSFSPQLRSARRNLAHVGRTSTPHGRAVAALPAWPLLFARKVLEWSDLCGQGRQSC